jgi:hypothetical protein
LRLRNSSSDISFVILKRNFEIVDDASDVHMASSALRENIARIRLFVFDTPSTSLYEAAMVFQRSSIHIYPADDLHTLQRLFFHQLLTLHSQFSSTLTRTKAQICSASVPTRNTSAPGSPRYESSFSRVAKSAIGNCRENARPKYRSALPTRGVHGSTSDTRVQTSMHTPLEKDSQSFSAVRWEVL